MALLTELISQAPGQLGDELSAIGSLGLAALLSLDNALADLPIGIDHDGVDASLGTIARLGENGTDVLEGGFRCVGVSRLIGAGSFIAAISDISSRTRLNQ